MDVPLLLSLASNADIFLVSAVSTTVGNNTLGAVSSATPAFMKPDPWWRTSVDILSFNWENTADLDIVRCNQVCTSVQIQTLVTGFFSAVLRNVVGPICTGMAHGKWKSIDIDMTPISLAIISMMTHQPLPIDIMDIKVSACTHLSCCSWNDLHQKCLFLWLCVQSTAVYIRMSNQNTTQKNFQPTYRPLLSCTTTTSPVHSKKYVATFYSTSWVLRYSAVMQKRIYYLPTVNLGIITHCAKSHD